ncbi:hypothetical protein [Winogradskyella undariae]|uniref:hypothetical protein n=1 Tax=Winogradskyella undariae TaxID=1285465 RepID=UPI0015CEE353|nr:hypothetical protein [Winogradskyella undariae]
MHTQVIQAIKDFDIKALHQLLDDEKSYMNVPKNKFINSLEKGFRTAKANGCEAFEDVFFGICEYCNKGCEGMTFLSNSGYYLDLFIETKDEIHVDDIYVCDKLTNVIDLNKVHSLGFYYSKDELVKFRPSEDYKLIKAHYQQFISDLKAFKKNVLFDDFIIWFDSFSSLRTSLQDISIYLKFQYKLYNDASGVIADIEKIANIKSNEEHTTEALINYSDTHTEREKLIWFYENRKDHDFIKGLINFEKIRKEGYIILKTHVTEVKIVIAGYEYIIDYYMKLQHFHNLMTEKYNPLPEHYEKSKNGYPCDLLVYLKLHNKHLDIVKKYQK